MAEEFFSASEKVLHHSECHEKSNPEIYAGES